LLSIVTFSLLVSARTRLGLSLALFFVSSEVEDKKNLNASQLTLLSTAPHQPGEGREKKSLEQGILFSFASSKLAF
jgi:hypothetical protein